MTFPQWNCLKLWQTTAALGSSSLCCGNGVDGNDDCMFTATTLHSGNLWRRLHVCINRVGGTTICVVTYSQLHWPRNTFIASADYLHHLDEQEVQNWKKGNHRHSVYLCVLVVVQLCILFDHRESESNMSPSADILFTNTGTNAELLALHGSISRTLMRQPPRLVLEQ